MVFNGQDAIHELEMLVANLVCVQCSRPAIDSQAFKDRPVDRDRLLSSSYELTQVLFFG